jgi:hypothetical protein
MNKLPDDIADALIAYLRQENPALNERQARLDLASIAELGKTREGRLTKDEIPTSLYYLAQDLAEVYVAHTGQILGRARFGGNGGEMLLTLANAADIADLKTELPYSLIQAQEAIKTTQRARNRKLNTKMMPGPWQREDARKDYLRGHVAGYADDEGNIVSHPIFLPTGEILEDKDGTHYAVVNGPEPILKGYRPAPDRPAAERFKDAIAKYKKD